MNKYDFDRIINRRDTDCVKWDNYDFKDEVPDMIPMWIADMDFMAPSFITDAIAKRLSHGIFGYTVVPQSYYAALAAWWKRQFDWNIERDWILPCPGVVPAINFAIKAFSSPGDKIVIQPPVYHPFRYSVTNNGRTLVNNPLKRTEDGYIMDFEDLRQAVSDKSGNRVKMIILSNPHNPVGRVWRSDELKKLGEVCLENNVLIISDEIHCDIVMPGHKHTPMAAISREIADITITLTSPSKTFNIAELQAANCIIPEPNLYSIFNKELTKAAITKPNLFGLIACEAAYTGGEEWTAELVPYIRNNYLSVKAFFEAQMPKVKVERMEGTYLAWLDFSALGMTHVEAEMTLLKKARVALSPGRIFGSQGEGFFRMNLACPASTIAEALGRIRDAFKGA